MLGFHRALANTAWFFQRRPRFFQVLGDDFAQFFGNAFLTYFVFVAAS